MGKIRFLPVLRTIFGFAILCSAAHAAEPALTHDTYVASVSPAVNFGGSSSLSVAPGSPGFVRFDLSTISPGANVSVAYLRVFVNKVTTPGALEFSAVTSPWIESAATFASQPTAAPQFGTASAAVSNAFLIVDVTTLPWASPGTLNSAAYFAAPVTLARPSTRDVAVPT